MALLSSNFMLRLAKHFIRIYTPFICTIAAHVNGVCFIFENIQQDTIFLFSTITGNSLIINLYMLANSLRMCVWYKLNILCLCLIHITSILYNYLNISDSVYLAAVTLLSSLGIICFLVFKALYKVTEFGCSRRR